MFRITQHVGLLATGSVADSKSLVVKAREEAADLEKYALARLVPVPGLIGFLLEELLPVGQAPLHREPEAALELRAHPRRQRVLRRPALPPERGRNA